MTKPDEKLPTAEEDFYREFASGLLKHVQRGEMQLGDKQLSTLLEDVGLPPIRVQSVNNKINRGTYSFTYALHVLAALGVKKLDVPPLPMDFFSLRITPRMLREDEYKIPSRFLEQAPSWGSEITDREEGRSGSIKITATGFIRGLNAIFRPAHHGGMYVVHPLSPLIQVSYKLPPQPKRQYR